MPTQVRIFTRPNSLGETLSAPHQTHAKETVPRSVPINGEIPINGIPEPTSPAYTTKKMGVNNVNDDKSYPGVTFAHQDKLPKLPIPDLAESCNRYLQALKPLQTPREHSDTKHAVQEFLYKDGPELQEKLKKYAEERTSYIEQFCEPAPASAVVFPVPVLTLPRVRFVSQLRQPRRAQPQPLFPAGG